MDSKRKKQARREAKILVLKGFRVEAVPAGNKKVQAGLSIDMNYPLQAKSLLMAAGYTDEQATLIVKNIIGDTLNRAKAIAASI